ncbi:pyridoxal phosphate-dependent aminotransferase [Sinorhizobium terangae]|uniref:aspartate transaminase n=1 Tax=Sinorhizobium terangae TaxID=110322 RepID=A0A6N7LEE2_SINTE|nr:pyridoxal phosphate-dependent aminotransferase [Sinorhizobium terangae]MBB4183889.1 arginine:pyruvate transaminase [Sinorhizobium terangae]MQX15084.1 aminotransferase class I/II-fold pyridoxal phosphate-dependent enzyme [Sinorhizobium terangae]WFU48024.1 pyridoxal phosphate-dependent aminotransferase [Sinorhizobium terangae]
MRYASITSRLADLGSGKWTLHIRARQLKAEGADIIELTIGEPDLPPDRSLLDECQRAMNAGRYRYSNGRGEPSVVAALAEKYRRRRADVTAENVLCFPGTQTALFAVMLGLVETGDAVLVGDPLYATYEGVIRSTGAHYVLVPLKPEFGFHMRAEDLEKAITPECRVLLLNTPHNPTGAVLTAAEIAAIGEVARRHDLWIVCDEVYEELVFDAAFASPFDNPDLAERTVVVSSISKSHAAPGFRSGWAVGPVEFTNRLLPISETMLFGVQPFIADMTAYALTHEIDTAKKMREAYKRRARRIVDGLADAPGVFVLPPEAGMFTLIDVSGTGFSGEAFAWALLEEEGVAVMPGSSFGEEAQNFLRVSLTVPDVDIDEACQRISSLAERLTARRERRA